MTQTIVLGHVYRHNELFNILLTLGIAVLA